MLLIISHHYYVHTPLYDFRTVNSGLTLINFILSRLLNMGGRLACFTFAIITGYFSIGHPLNKKRMFLLVIETLFYTWVIGIISIILGYADTSWGNLKNVFFPFYDQYWFIKYYVLFSIFIPFFNILIDHMSQKQHLYLIIVLLIIYGILDMYLGLNLLPGQMMMFVVAYLIGSFIKKYEANIAFLNNKRIWNKILLLSIIIQITPTIIVALLRYYQIIDNETTKYATMFADPQSPPAIVVAISLFMIFHFHTFYTAWINKTAHSVIGVYLIHDNIFSRIPIWTISSGINYIDTPYFLLHAILKIVFVFVTCTLIDQARILLLEKQLMKFIQKSRD